MGDLTDFRRWLDSKQLSDKTKHTYIIFVRQLLDQFKKINQKQIEKFAYEKPVYPSKIAALNYFLEYKKINFRLKNVTYTKRKPRQEVRLKKLKKLVKKVGDNVENLDVYWVYQLLLVTGARIIEILRLKIEDIDFDGGRWLAEPSIRLKTKGGKERVVRIPEKIMKKLKDYLFKQKGLLQAERCFFRTTWRRDQSKAKNEHNVYVRFRKHIYQLAERGILTKQEKNKLLKTHNFRRAVINYILRTTEGDITAAKAFIGHKDISTTDKYRLELDERRARKRAYRIMEEV